MVGQDDLANEADETLVYPAAPLHANVKLNVEAGLDEVRAALADLHTADNQAEHRKKVLGWAAAGDLALAFAALVEGAVLEVKFLYIVALVFGAGVVPILVVRHILGRADVDDRKLDAPAYVLRWLAGDIKPGSPVALSLDFGSYEKTPVLDKAGGIFSPQKSWVHHKVGWLKLRFVLLDGTRVQVTASTVAKRKTRAKRKYTKIKDRVVDELRIVLTAPRGQTLDTNAAAELYPKFSRRGRTLRRCQIKPRAALFDFRLGPARRVCVRGNWHATGLESLVSGPTLLHMLITTYRACAQSAIDRAA